MKECAVPTARQVVVPAELVHPRTSGVPTGNSHAGHRPQHVEEIAGVPLVSLAAVRGEAHPRKVLGGFAVAQQAKHHCGNAVLAVVVMGLDPRSVVAVGNAALSHVEPQKPHAFFDGLVQGRIVHARLTRQDQRNSQRHARRVHHPIAAQPSIRLDKAMPPRTDDALTANDFHSDSLEIGREAPIAGGQRVLGQENVDRAVEPTMQITPLRIGVFRGPFHLFAHQRQVFRFAARQQRQSVERANDRVARSRIFLHLSGEGFAAGFKNPFRFRAFERSHGTIGPEDSKLHNRRCRLAVAPADQREFAIGGFGGADRLAQFSSRVEREGPARHS